MRVNEIINILKKIEYKKWEFYTNGLWLQVRFCTHDIVTGKLYYAHGRKWQLSEYMTKSEIVQTALKAALGAEEHETRELFKYDGKAVFNPHINVDALLSVCDNTEQR